MTYKKLVELIINVESVADIWAADHEMDRSFDAGKITVQDHKNLSKLLNKMMRLYDNK